MRPLSFVILLATLVFGLPIPLPQSSDTSGLLLNKPTEAIRKLLSKRQWSDLSWYQTWGPPAPDEQHWKNPSVNPFDICATPEGKTIGAQCSGGSIIEDHTDGFHTEHSDIHFTAWTIGPADKPGWNPFAPPQTPRAGIVGISGVSGGRAGTTGTGRTTSATSGGTGQVNQDTSPVNLGSTGTTLGSTKDTNKVASGCMDLLGVASVGNNC